MDIPDVAEEDAERRFFRSLSRAGQDRNNAFITFNTRFECEPGGALFGTLLGVKDNVAVRGMRMTCASNLLQNYLPPYEATAVRRLREAGCAVIGKNNMDEFACGSSGENSAFGPTLNPLFPGKVAGGSSSGSAVSVAEGLVDAALGSDTGGSVRCPSAFCSVVGLKPTYGRVSRYGLVDMAMSLDAISPMVKFGNELLLARILDVISGYDRYDQKTYASRRTECERKLDSFNPEDVSVAIPENTLSHCTAEVRDAFWKSLSFLGRRVRIEKVTFKRLDISLATYYIIMYSEFASAMQRYDGLKFGTRADGDTNADITSRTRSLLGKEVRRRILIGTYITSMEGRHEWYERALSARALIIEEMQSILERNDFIFMPTMPSRPFSLGERNKDPVQMYDSDIFTVISNLTGLPSVTFPSGRGIGTQIIGRHNTDEAILSIIHHYHKNGWKWQ